MKIATIQVDGCCCCPNKLAWPTEYPVCKLTKGTGRDGFREITELRVGGPSVPSWCPLPDAPEEAKS